MGSLQNPSLSNGSLDADDSTLLQKHDGKRQNTGTSSRPLVYLVHQLSLYVSTTALPHPATGTESHQILPDSFCFQGCNCTSNKRSDFGVNILAWHPLPHSTGHNCLLLLQREFTRAGFHCCQTYSGCMLNSCCACCILGCPHSLVPARGTSS